MGNTAKQTAKKPENLTSIKHHPAANTGENQKNGGGEGVEKVENQVTGSIIQQLEARVFNLNQQLNDAERKLRNNENEHMQKRRELQDEIAKLKKESSEGGADAKIENLEKRHELEKEHAKEIKEKEKRINELETELKFKELEQSQGDKDTFDKMMLVFERFADSGFLGKVMEGLSNMQPAGGQNGQYSKNQLQEAVQNAQQGQKPNNPETPEQAESRENPDSQPENLKKIPPEQMQEAKNQVKQALLNSAMQALTDKNVNLGHYADAVRRQIQVSKQQGIELDAKEWIKMAKVLAEHALDREVTAERVAKVISPVLDGVKKYSFFLQSMEPKGATNALFNYFNIEASEPVKKLVAKVLEAIKQSQ
jgi:predicted RNase H-like nuclease (RuvC/YqgF family)